MNYLIKTTADPAGQIVQETFLESLGDLRQTISRNVMDLQDAGIRAALIKLGWTPPADDEEV